MRAQADSRKTLAWESGLSEPVKERRGSRVVVWGGFFLIVANKSNRTWGKNKTEQKVAGSLILGCPAWTLSSYMHDALRQTWLRVLSEDSEGLRKCSQSVLGSACMLNLQNSLDQHGGAHLSLNTWKEEANGLLSSRPASAT